jgi:hypothetical protein
MERHMRYFEADLRLSQDLCDLFPGVSTLASWRSRYAPAVAASPSATAEPVTKAAPAAVPASNAGKSKRKSTSVAEDTDEEFVPVPTASGTVSKWTINAWSKGMTTWFDGKVPGGLGSIVRKMLPGFLSVALVGLVASAGNYLWLIILVPVVLFGLWSWVRQPNPTSTAPGHGVEGASADASPMLVARSPMSQGLRTLIAVGVIVVIAGVIGGIAYYKSWQYPAEREVNDYLTSTAVSPPVRVATPQLTKGVYQRRLK